jgi:hypothetical protein
MAHRVVGLRIAVIGTLVALLAVACTPTAPTSTPKPATHVPVQTQVPPTPYVIQVEVTLTETPTATPLFQDTDFAGRWAFDLRYELRNSTIIDDITYAGGADLSVDGDGGIAGTVSLYTTATTSRCRANLTSTDSIDAQISGKLRKLAGGDVVGDLTITPVDAAQKTTIQKLCDKAQPILLSEPLLWPALTALDQLSLTVPFHNGISQNTVLDLTGPTAGGLHGLFTGRVQLQR